MGIRSEIKNAFAAAIKQYRYIGSDTNYSLPLARADWLQDKVLSILNQRECVAMSDTITLTREEIKRARESSPNTGGCERFLDYDINVCEDDPEKFAHCRLCKRITLFAKGERDE